MPGMIRIDADQGARREVFGGADVKLFGQITAASDLQDLGGHFAFTAGVRLQSETDASVALVETQVATAVCASLGVIFSVVYIVIGAAGVKLLRDLRDRKG